MNVQTLNSLEAYGFGLKCKNWFKLLNKSLKANILVNSFTTESINKEQSVKQGDAYHAHYSCNGWKV